MCEKGQSSNGEISDCELGKKGSSNEAVSTTQKVKTYQRGEKKITFGFCFFLGFELSFFARFQRLVRVASKSNFFLWENTRLLPSTSKKFRKSNTPDSINQYKRFGQNSFQKSYFHFFLWKGDHKICCFTFLHRKNYWTRKSVHCYFICEVDFLGDRKNRDIFFAWQESIAPKTPEL